jgi:gliding motility-associated lipoprotein GldH
MKNHLLAALALSFVLFSCQPEGRVYSDHKELSPELEWLQKDKREFQVPIEDADTNYDLSLSFRYATGFPHKTLNVKVTEISPSGSEQVKEYKLQVRDDKGGYIGDPGLDIWDSEHLVDENISYDEKGTYTYVIEHIMPQDPVNYAMEIGLIIDKAK